MGTLVISTAAVYQFQVQIVHHVRMVFQDLIIHANIQIDQNRLRKMNLEQTFAKTLQILQRTEQGFGTLAMLPSSFTGERPHRLWKYVHLFGGGVV